MPMAISSQRTSFAISWEAPNSYPRPTMMATSTTATPVFSARNFHAGSLAAPMAR